MNHEVKLFGDDNRYHYRGRNSKGEVLLRKASDWGKSRKHLKGGLIKVSSSQVESSDIPLN